MNRTKSPHIARARQARPARTTKCNCQLSPVFRSSDDIMRLRVRRLRAAGSGPRIAHRAQPKVCVTAPFHARSR
jgi:hypothetical protein